LRASLPAVLFDSRHVYDAQPLVWDDVAVSGAGTSSTFNANESSVTIAVSNAVAGRRVRQSKQRTNYQPGKSQLVLMSGVLGAGAAGLTISMGWGDDENGFFWRSIDGAMNITRRSFATGAAVDTDIAQAAWNLDRLDGTGASGITLDPATAQILCIDAEWLGVGRVRFGFVIDGQIFYAHEFLHANIVAGVYMSSATLPLQCSIENDGAGPAAGLVSICTSVQSESGQQETGSLRYASTAGASVNANAVGTIYAIVGIRQRAAQLNSVIKPVRLAAVALTADPYEWLLILNPTVAGVFTYANVVNSPAQAAIGDVTNNPSTNTVTLGTVVEGGYGGQRQSIAALAQNALYIGSTIAGVVDELVFCVRPLAVNLDIAGGMLWRETV
jgi:hypothetical protein